MNKQLKFLLAVLLFAFAGQTLAETTRPNQFVIQSSEYQQAAIKALEYLIAQGEVPGDFYIDTPYTENGLLVMPLWRKTGFTKTTGKESRRLYYDVDRKEIVKKQIGFLAE
jgi:hypothetical protein